MSKKFLTTVITGIAVVVLMPAVAFAHVIVTPNQVGIGQELTFNVSVPNERPTPVVNIRLNIPNGVTNVIPTVKDGWTTQTVSNNSAKDPETTAIIWVGGSIPVGEREDFSFSAQVPSGATEIDWKAYQTYGDGAVVHWDQKPAGSDDASGNAGPYSVTKVTNDLTTPSVVASASDNTLPLMLSIAALVLSVAGLLIHRKK